MADPLLAIPDVIKQTGKVARFLVEYGMQVKDAPVLIQSITLEVNTLKAILETLQATLGYNPAPTHKAGLAESLDQCKKLLHELLQLVVPEPETESDEEEPPIKPPRNSARGPFCRFGRSKPAAPTPCRDTNDNHNAGQQLQSLTHTRITSEHYRTQYEAYNYDTNQNVPRTPTRAPRRNSVMGLAARFRWPLFQKSKAEDMLRRLERQKTQLSLALQTDNA
ncbi:hypothetical protein Daesc_005212 [Daldinia eschscholtzii]|uniref:Uncharacterized protein n=1 Tax=Daldinia eschscholtzii TaxID=292717 RepID=A0AAX6MJV0_9PEZI